MTAMGIKIDNFSVPVCNSFRAKIHQDQLCYEVDLNKIKNKDNFENDLKLGLVFFMDYNEDRQTVANDDVGNVIDNSWVGKVDKTDDEKHAFIYLNTIG